MSDSKRINKLREEIIKELPVFPNNKETKEHLESKMLTDLLIDYISWKTRLVTPRKRKIIINDEVDLSDEKVASILESEQYMSLKNKIHEGDDINPYLSLQAHQKGYSPDAKINNESWIDKDFLLNVMNLYHFHLLPYEKGKQESTRSDELIFAKVDKTTFEIIGIFDHSVFESDKNSVELNGERKRLWKTWDKIIMKNVPEGSIVIPTTLTLSGHTQAAVSVAMEYAKIIREYDKKVEEKEFLDSLYANGEMPNNPKLKWYFNGTDLGLLDKNHNYFILKHGKN